MHLWTLKRTATAVSNGVSIREYSCPLHFRCNCRVSLRVVHGDHFIQLERRGLHHINSHVAHTIDDNDQAQVPQDLIDDSYDNDDFDDDEDSKDDGDSDDEDECDNYSENSSDDIQYICFPYQK